MNELGKKEKIQIKQTIKDTRNLRENPKLGEKTQSRMQIHYI